MRGFLQDYIISTTGIAGLTLGGGIGYLTRGAGLSLDNLVSADVVLPDGSFVTAGKKNHEDLFWALRGGGGNFGIVTSFEFRLHRVRDIVGGPMFFEAEDAAKVIRASPRSEPPRPSSPNGSDRCRTPL